MNEPVSDCCGCPIPDHEECDLCPNCMEHCGVSDDAPDDECDNADRKHNEKMEDSL